MSLTITPSVGRKVWYYENASQSQPMDATIIKVHPDADNPELGPLSLVNLSVRLPDNGTHRFVHAVQAREEPVDAPHYRWMPFQTGQAKAAATPGPDIFNVDMRVNALEDRCSKIADYVGLPSAEELTAAQQWDTAVGQLGNTGDNGADSAGGVLVGAGNSTVAIPPPATDEFVAPGASLFSDPSQTKPIEESVHLTADDVLNVTSMFPGDLTSEQKAVLDEQPANPAPGSGPL